MGYQTILDSEYMSQYKSMWPNKTILDYLNDAIEKNPDKLAVIDGKSRYTYEELGKLVDRVALGLLEMGLKKGDVVSFQLPNWSEFIILHYAVTRMGGISNPLVPIFRDREIGFMVKQAEAKMLVVPDYFRGYDYPAMVERLKDQLPNLEHAVVVGENVPAGMTSFSNLLDEPWEELRDPAILDEIEHDPNGVSAIMFTSGTTGEPKGVLHSHNTLCISAEFWIEHFSLNSTDVMFMASTLAHLTGFLYGARMATHFGGTVVLQESWNPVEFVQLIEKEGVTITCGATPFLSDTVYVEDIENYDISSLKVFVTAGAPIPPSIIKEANEKLPAKICAGWGQTENGMVTATSPQDSLEKLLETDGSPIARMEVKVVNFEGEASVVGEEGELLCRGPGLFIGYLKQLEYTYTQFDDGWFITGDRAMMDKDGYIRISGRNKDIVVRGGENIPVAYVEDTLYEHPDISIAQIVSMPDPRLQEKACAFISMKPGKAQLTIEEIQAYLLEKGLAKQYWPERVEVIEDEFPRTASGKIQKYQLREMIKQKLETESKV